MSASEPVTKRKIGVTTILSSLFIIVMILWGTYTVMLIQLDQVRSEEPHVPLQDIEPWNYNIDWAGGRTNWFDDINYTDLPLDQQLPEDLLDQMNNTLFMVSPADPAQLWRNTAYDIYDGSGWRKSISDSATSLTGIDESSAQNEIYTVSMNVSVSANTEPIELPSLFPEIQVIDGSFRSTPASALIDYYLETDVYGTLLFYPFLSGNLGDTVLIQYEISYVTQDLANTQANAQHGSVADASVSATYGSAATRTDLSTTVTDVIDQFRDPDATAYETAMAVDLYFRTNYEIMMNETQINERPGDQEVTEWFIERGGGLPMDFATAYCVFMRDLEIPARMTLGYAMGDLNPDGSDSRLVKVMHMLFWAEVYIPFSPTEGEWIQVIPIPLPSDFAGGDLPENLDAGNVSIYVGTPENIILQLLTPGTPLIPQWSMIGDEFNLSALVVVNGQPYTGSEPIRFYDLTDGVDIGTTNIEFTPDGSHLPFANISYTFPDGSSVGAHNISAMWITSTFLTSGYTSWVAVGQSSPSEPIHPTSLQSPSETIDLNVRLGLTDYTAQWMDTLHVYGTMTIGGSPANGSQLAALGNDQMWILWDGIWYGNATIGNDGYYELDIYLDPSDLLRMNAGNHNVSAFYAGAFDPEYGYPVVIPGSSPDSIVELSAVVGFDLFVTPTSSYGGGTITYDGRLYLLNGTILSTETVGIIFDGSIVDTALTNGTGGFNYDYILPGGQPTGTYPAQVNWTSGIPLVNGNTSLPVFITIESGSTTLTIDSAPADPQVVHIYEDITISGTLTATSDGAPLVGRTVDIYWDWNNGTVQLLGSNTTIAGGYYEFTYTIPAYSEGYGTYWAQFDSVEPTYQSSISTNMSITVKRYDVTIYIETVQSSVVVGEDLDIQGYVFAPEIPALLGGALVNLWWDNGSVFNIGNNQTSNGTGVYTFNYTVPLTHPLQVVSLWANFTTPSPAYYSAESSHIPITVRNYDSYVSVSTNSSIIHLNETVYIYGYLEHENGSALTGQQVDITWNNGTVNIFTVYTNSTGWYNFYYNCSVDTDSEGTVSITVDHTSLDPSYSSSNANLVPPLTLQLYQVSFTSDVDPTSIHLDESFIFDGVLSFDHNGNPISGATIWVYYQYANGTEFSLPKTTNSTGGFLFQYNASLTDSLGAIYVWAQYNSTDPLWDDAISFNHTVNLILYDLTLTTFTNSSSYFIDETVFVWGRLTFTHNNSELVNQPITIYWYDDALSTYGPVLTNSTGYFNFTYTLVPGVDPTGSVNVWAEFTSLNPYWDNATSSPGPSFSVALYDITIDLSVSPNPQYLNETLTIQADVYFTHNSTRIVGMSISFVWDNGTLNSLGSFATDGSGQISFSYSNMDEDTLWSVDVYATYSGSVLIGSDESNHVTLTLEQWLTVITGFDTGGITTFELTDTVVVTGTLYYDMPVTDIAFGGAVVEILVNGSPVNTTTTASDGSFIGYWTIPTNTPLGDYDITVRYTSDVNWIADYTYNPATTITITAISIVWTFAVSPDPVYRSEVLYISGTLDLSNGSVYAGATVTIYWQSISQSVPSQISVQITDGSGFFELWYQVSDNAELGLTTILVDCSSGTPVIAYSGTSDTVNVEQIPVSLTGGGSVSGIIYLDDTIDFSGTLTFVNLTPMVGYNVSILWDDQILTTLVTDGFGEFSFSYQLPWDEPVRNITYYIRFDRPSEAYQEAQTEVTDLEIHDIVSMTIDTQTVDVVYRGDTLTISGTVTNGGGGAVDVPIAILRNGTQSGVFVVTDSDGEFSVNFLMRDTIPYGTHNFSLSIPSNNYDVTSSPAYWIVEIHITSTVTVAFADLSDLFVGGTFTISYTVLNQESVTPVGDAVSVYLNGTYVTDIVIVGAGTNTATITLSSWNEQSGYYVAVVEWGGTSYIDSSFGESTESIHLIASAMFDDDSFGPPFAAVNSLVRISGRLVDDAGYPISDASVEIYLNRTTSNPAGPSTLVTTDDDGRFTYDLPFEFTTTGSYYFEVLYAMTSGDVTDRYTFQITSGAPPGFDTALLITWAVAIGIEAIIALIIVARYRYNRGGSGFFGFRLRSRRSEMYDSLVR